MESDLLIRRDGHCSSISFLQNPAGSSSLRPLQVGLLPRLVLATPRCEPRSETPEKKWTATLLMRVAPGTLSVPRKTVSRPLRGPDWASQMISGHVVNQDCWITLNCNARPASPTLHARLGCPGNREQATPRGKTCTMYNVLPSRARAQFLST